MNLLFAHHEIDYVPEKVLSVVNRIQIMNSCEFMAGKFLIYNLSFIELFIFFLCGFYLTNIFD